MVYLIHFEQKLHHAQHYIGFVETDFSQRITQHRLSRGARLLAALNERGIKWNVVRIWRGADRQFERWLKTGKKPAFSVRFAGRYTDSYLFTLNI